MAGDPSVGQGSSRYQGAGDGFLVRGFRVGGVQLNGVRGLVNTASVGSTALIGVERVELLRGANALLSGSSGALGGTVNFVAKRATDAPINQLTVGFVSDATGYVQLDIGRRFGENKAFGIRTNLQYRDGDTPIRSQSERVPAIRIGADYRADSVRASFDFGYQETTISPQARAPTITGGFRVPSAPENSEPINPPWAVLDGNEVFGLGRVEYDISSQATAYATYGASRGSEHSLLATATIINAAGDINSLALSSDRIRKTRSFDAGLRWQLSTGPVRHNLAMNYVVFDQDLFLGLETYQNSQANLYRPFVTARPQTRPVATPLASSSVDDSFGIADTLSFGENVDVIVAVRRQNISVKNYATTGTILGRYDRSAWTPSASVIARLQPNLSIYGTYIEALEQGPTAPNIAINAGEVFSPVKSRQYEIGVKADLGDLGAQIALFDLSRATGGLDPATSIFSIIGNQRNRGIEIFLFGEPVRGFRVNSGIALLEGRFVRATNPLFQGKEAPAATPFRATVGLEMDITPAITITGRAAFAGRQVVDNANTQRIPGYSRLDAGLRWQTDIFGKELLLRASIENIFDRNYFIVGDFNTLSLSIPRTFLFSATANF